MALTNISASVLARLKNQAKEQKIPFQTCLQLFFQEELLRRLSKTQYKENLILKGGMFIYTLTDFKSRVTKDVDFMLRQMSNDLAKIEKIINVICSTDTGNNYLKIEILDTENDMLDNQYPGVKVKLLGRINNIRVPFSIDIGVDDIIVPSPFERKIKTRLDGFESPVLLTYSLESTIAEKFDAILKRMETTSRMKDFFDIFYLSGIFDFTGAILSDAIRRTFEHRKREIETDTLERIEAFKHNQFLLTQWKNHDPAKEAGLAFEDSVSRLLVFLGPIYKCMLSGSEFTGNWSSEGHVWK